MKTTHTRHFEIARASVSRCAAIQTGAALAAGVFAPALVRAQQKTLVQHIQQLHLA